MIYAFNNATQSVSTNAPVVFNSTGAKAGKTTVLSGGNINIRVPGNYLINFNADVTSSVVGTAAFQLTLGGTVVNGAIARSSIATATDVRNVGFTAIVNIPQRCPCLCSCTDNTVTLGVVSTGISTTLLNAGITVTKIN